MNEYVHAGVRVIFKRALREIGLDPKPETDTATLVGLAVGWNAPVILLSRRWLMFSEGKPDLSKNERELMKEQAIQARLLWTEGRQLLRRKNAKN